MVFKKKQSKKMVGRKPKVRKPVIEQVEEVELHNVEEEAQQEQAQMTNINKILAQVHGEPEVQDEEYTEDVQEEEEEFILPTNIHKILEQELINNIVGTMYDKTLGTLMLNESTQKEVLEGIRLFRKQYNTHCYIPKLNVCVNIAKQIIHTPVAECFDIDEETYILYEDYNTISRFHVVHNDISIGIFYGTTSKSMGMAELLTKQSTVFSEDITNKIKAWYDIVFEEELLPLDLDLCLR